MKVALQSLSSVVGLSSVVMGYGCEVIGGKVVGELVVDYACGNPLRFYLLTSSFYIPCSVLCSLSFSSISVYMCGLVIPCPGFCPLRSLLSLWLNSYQLSSSSS